ncbi:MAG: EFR1 family ferrodoxin [Halanaerobiales bacterium]
MDSKVYKRAGIVYFSGTGGTARVANLICKFLVEYGVSVTKAPLEHNNYSKTNMTPIKHIDLIIVLFPVYAFDAPEPIYRWINGLPKGEGTPVVIISVSGAGNCGPNTACRVGIIKRLQKKCFKIVYEKMMIMPSNFVIPINKQLAIRLLNVLPSKTEQIVKEVMEGKKRRIKPKLSGRILRTLFKIEKPCAKLFAKGFKVKESCNVCGWCAENCPMDNIELQGNRPIFSSNCLACLRCIYGCPQNAIYTSIYSFVPLKEGYDLNELEKLADDFELKPLDNIKVSYLFKAVKDYLMEK